MAGFDDIYGQELIVSYLKKTIKENKISHAYIIEGEKYSGKEFVANTFARAMLCKGEDRPCDQCQSCSRAMTRNHPDILYLTHEKPNVIGVDDIRNQINGTMDIKPYQSDYKIYICNEAEKMNQNAQNALLKTLEEPPEYGIILLLTDNIESLLPTIRSRCVILKMKPVADSVVKDFLCSRLQVPDYRAEICAAFARGNIGKAKILASSEEFDRIKDMAVNLLKHIDEMDTNEILATVKEISAYKLEVNDFLDILAIWYRDALLFKATSDYNGLVFRDEAGSIKRTASRTSYEGIEDVLKALDVAKRRLSANVGFDLTMELLLTTIKENS